MATGPSQGTLRGFLRRACAAARKFSSPERLWLAWLQAHAWRQDKGQKAEVAAFMKAVQDGEPSPIRFEELIEVTRVSFEIMQVARQGCRR